MYFITAFVISLFIFLLTTAPTIYNLDSAELTTAAATLGFTRSTGYPLYILLGHLWSKIPIGDVGYRLNVFSAFSGALTVGFLALILKKLEIRNWVIVSALGLLISSKFFWALSLIAEVYTLQTALMAALIYFVFEWKDNPNNRNSIVVGFLIGLCLCHHAATILMMPAILWLIFSSVIKNKGKFSLVCAGMLGLVIGLTPYLYFPIRYPMIPVFNYAGSYDGFGQFISLKLNTIEGIWSLLSSRPFTRLMFTYSFVELIYEMRFFAGSVWKTFMGIGIGPGILGLIILVKHSKTKGLTLLVIFLCHAFFFVNYKVVDKEMMFLPNYLIWMIWFGIGLEWMIKFLEKSISRKYKWITISSFKFAVVGIVLVAFIINFPLVDQSKNWSARYIGEKILSEVEPNALIFGYWDVVPVLEYLTFVEDIRPDTQAINRFLISQKDMQTWIIKEIQNRPVYLDKRLPGLPNNIIYTKKGELFKLSYFIP